MDKRPSLTLLIVLSILTTSSAGVVVAANTTATSSEYELDVTNAIDTPAETVEIEGSEYQVDEIGTIEPGDVIEAEITSAENYFILLYNSDKKSEYDEYLPADQSTVRMGSAEDEFNTGNLEPGTYLLSLEPDTEGRVAVTPIVVQGYDLSLEYPTTVEQGSEITIEATVEPIDDLAKPNSVKVAIWDGNNVSNVTLEQTEGTSYETTVSLSEFETGTYSVYGAVIDDEKAEGYSTSLAVADGASLTVTEPDDSTGGSDGGDSGGGTDSDDSGSTDTGSNNTETDDNETETDPDDMNETDGTLPNESNTGSDDSNDSSDETDRNTTADTGSDASTDDGESTEVIEPNDTDEDGTSAASNNSGDGLGTPAIIPVALAVGIFLVSAKFRS